MIYGLLVSLFVLLCFMLIGVILVQKGKSSMGLGGLGGGAQMLFGGSGGQDMFQKMTWVMVALFMSGSLVLALMKSSSRNAGYARPRTQQLPVSPSADDYSKPAQTQAAPITEQAPVAPVVPAN